MLFDYETGKAIKIESPFGEVTQCMAVFWRLPGRSLSREIVLYGVGVGVGGERKAPFLCVITNQHVIRELSSGLAA